MGVPETSASTNLRCVTFRKNRRPHLHHGRSSKSRTVTYTNTQNLLSFYARNFTTELQRENSAGFLKFRICLPPLARSVNISFIHPHIPYHPHLLLFPSRVLQCMCFLYGLHCLHQFKYQSKFLQQFRTLENYQSSTEELFICSDIVMKKVGTTHLSHRYQFTVTNDRTGPVGNVWAGGKKIVAYLSILEFDISSVRSFLC